MMEKETPSRRKLRLMQWMRQYGDRIARTCCLLCGNPQEARKAAQLVFIRAFYQMDAHADAPQDALHLLLSIACQTCLANANERALLALCLYNGLSLNEATDMLHIDTQAAAQFLKQAEQSAQAHKNAFTRFDRLHTDAPDSASSPHRSHSESSPF